VGSQQLLTIQRAVQYLAQIADGGPVTVQALAERFGVPASTAYRYVASLRHAGMLWDLPGGRLGLGPRCVQLEMGFRQALDQWSPYRPVMSELAALTGETVTLLVPVEDEAVCIDTVDSDKPLRFSLARGVARPLLRSALSTAMLPYLPADQLDRLLAREPRPDAARRERLLSDLPVVRARGYTVSRDEVDCGVWAVGVPVFDQAGACQGALSTIAPNFRTEGREPFLIRATVEAGRHLLLR